MMGTTLCISTNSQFGLSNEEQIVLFQKAGFDGFFTMWDKQVARYKELADELGMVYQSIHAPYLNAAKMWQEGDTAEEAVAELLACVEDCAKLQVPLLVVHAYIGFGKSAGPTEAGIRNFQRVVDAAVEKKVKIAFENTEGEEYLAALMDAFKECPWVGFCWDTGHELCVNDGKDMMALYGDRLMGLHLNDSLGVRDKTWTDDLHLLPFDGIADWEGVVDKLNFYGFHGCLSFELNTVSKPGRHENDKYQKMPLEEYLAEAYARACRVAALKKRRSICQKKR